MTKRSAVRGVVLVTGVLAAVVLAQPEARAASVNTAKGSCSWLFQFNGLSDLSVSSYKGGIGVRHFLSDRTAIRPMVMFGMHTDKDKAVTEGAPERKDTDTTIGAELTLEKHAQPIGPVSPYMGIQGGFSSIQHKTTFTNSASPETKAKELNFGVGVVGGFVWGFAEGVTLGGEYSVSATFGSSDTKVNDVKVSDGSRTDIGVGTASLFLSVAMK